mgnify:CR=1 FL=1|tara:strand:- start:223 stop:660 length:438 start_codon:yes stop_codon:yes gene_type:complete
MAENSDNSEKNNKQTPKSLFEQFDNIDKDTEETLEEQMNKLGDSNAFSDIINNLKTLGNEDSLNNLFKDFTDSFQNSANSNNNTNNNFSNNQDDEDLGSENFDFETLNLDKYLLDDNGTNICSILSKINSQLQNINDNLSKMHDR